MRAEDRDIVAAGCAGVLAAGHGMLPPAETANDCADWLRQAVAEYRPIFRHGRQRERAGSDHSRLYRWLNELAACVYADMITMSEFRTEHGQPGFWDDPHPAVRDATFRRILFQMIFSQLCNYLSAANTLARHGQDLQLLVLFRGLVELSDTALACACDQNFFRKYVDQLSNDETFSHRKWSQTLSPRVVRATLDASVRRLALEPEVAEEIHKYRSSTYSWLSAHHHGHPVALLVRSYDDHGPTLGGVPGANTDSILGKLFYHTFEALSLWEVALGQVHGWTMDPKHAFCREFMFKWRAFRSIANIVMTREEIREEARAEGSTDA